MSSSTKHSGEACSGSDPDLAEGLETLKLSHSYFANHTWVCSCSQQDSGNAEEEEMWRKREGTVTGGLQLCQEQGGTRRPAVLGLVMFEVRQEQDSSPSPGTASLPSQETEDTPQSVVLSSQHLSSCCLSGSIPSTVNLAILKKNTSSCSRIF